MMAQAVCRGEVCILGSSSTGRRLRDKDKCGMASTGVPQTIQPLFSEHNVVTPSPWWNSEYPSQVAMATKREMSMVMELIKGEERKATWDSRCYLLQVSLSWKSLCKLVYISKGRVGREGFYDAASMKTSSMMLWDIYSDAAVWGSPRLL